MLHEISQIQKDVHMLQCCLWMLTYALDIKIVWFSQHLTYSLKYCLNEFHHEDDTILHSLIYDHITKHIFCDINIPYFQEKNYICKKHLYNR